ncbi:PTS system sorbose subfamily IIB component [Gemmatirosa kalamazoonensis]|uniref:PTS system sorbose subfamily IIB component n=1 Tax=Gemmatirosa kalamazoonensis TaxID=861299 RepID=W0RJZ4_9BACT|nr:PTS sugar transporter subunit IIB [Gemmatirosa kalamazoonensis]AHG90660.1 PTS system sorbose subfamily IIB component [Gemmatirosa kalamazoonensis]
MPLELYRIDDRLIHGQVVVGWGRPLDIGFIVLVDDEVAASEWEQELYRMGVPPEMDVFFHGVDDAISAHARYAGDRRHGILLTGDIDTMARLIEGVRRNGGPPGIAAVNLGGVHHRVGRAQRMRYVFLTPEEEAALRAMASRGVAVTAQDVPSTRPVPLDEVLSGKASS